MDADKTYEELNAEFIAVDEELNDLYNKIEKLNNRRAELREALHNKRPARRR